MVKCYLFLGASAYIRDTNNPDWKPTLKLGHSDIKVVDSDRYSRLCQRKVTNAAATCTSSQSVDETTEASVYIEGCGSGLSISNSGLETAPPDTDDDGGTFSQTDIAFSTLTAEEEIMLRTELNRLTVENYELKEKLASKEMTLESLREREDSVRYFTGLADFLTLTVVFNFVRGSMSSDKRRALSAFQSLMLTLMHIRLNTPLQHLAYIFCVSKTTSSKVFHETIHVLYHRLKPVVFWPDRQSIRTSLPVQFLEYPWKRCVSIIDCFEIFTERPSTSDASALTWSNYKHNNTIKYLISITPQGHISFLSRGWGGRVSDKKITEESGYLNHLLPNDLVLADRGFDICELVGMRAAEVKIPAFTRGKAQLTALEIESTRSLAHLRIHVERVIGVLCSKYTILNSTIPTELLFVRSGEQITTLDKIVTVGSALVNMCPGII